MKIVVLDGYTLNPGDLSWKGFEKIGQLTVHDITKSEQTIERIGDAEIVITNKTLLTKEIFDACKNIKYVGVLATGYNVVDVNAAKEQGILVTNIPAYGTNTVAQFAISLLLEVCNRVGAHSDAVASGRWQKTGGHFCFWDYPMLELDGKTMGVIGYGRIGQATAKMAKAFGMKIVAYSRSKKPGTIEDHVHYISLDELFASSDVISLHCPLSSSTEGIINKDSLSKTKQGAIIINTSRGGLIVEQDLADWLNADKGYAAVDVVSEEPMKDTNPLHKAKNCIITPHIAWATKEARTRLMDIAVDNLSGFVSGTPKNIVN